MGSMYKNRGIRQRYADAAAKSPHFNAILASRNKVVVHEYEVGEYVRVKTTGKVGRITGKESWGDYVLEGHSGSFVPSALEPDT